MSHRTSNSFVRRARDWLVAGIVGLLIGTGFGVGAQESNEGDSKKSKKEEMSEANKRSDIWIKLKARKEKLDKREKELEKKQKRLEELQKKVSGKKSNVEKKVRQLASKKGPCAKIASKILQGKKYDLDKMMPDLVKKEASQAERTERIKKLTSKVKQMRAGSAATLLAEMKRKLAVSILAELGARSSGPILNNMSSSVAAELSQQMIERKQTVKRKDTNQN